MLVRCMIKAVLTETLLILCVLCLCGCGSMITKPINLATKAVVTPIKAVAGVTADVVGKPLGKAARLVRPVTPVIQVR